MNPKAIIDEDGNSYPWSPELLSWLQENYQGSKFKTTFREKFFFFLNYESTGQLREKIRNKFHSRLIYSDISEWVSNNTDHENYILDIPDRLKKVVDREKRKCQSNKKIVLIDISELHIVEDVVDRVSKLGFDNYIILHTNRTYKGSERALFFPTDLITRSFEYPLNPIKKHKNHLVSCLNRRPAGIRMYNFFRLSQKKYFDPLVNLMTNKHLHGEDVDFLSNSFNDVPVEIRQKLLELNILHSDLVDNDVSFNHIAFTDSYANICIETNPTQHYFTEKTAKPIAAGQFFFQVNAPGSMNILKDMGIDIFDDIFDHNYYDNEPDPMVRIDKMFEIIDVHVDNLHEIHERCYNRLIANRDYFLSDKFRNKWFDDLSFLVETLTF